jgi:hypothetical protein
VPDHRGSWFRVYSRQVIVHPKFRALTYTELGAWVALRSEADLLGGVPFPDRRAAIQALARKKGPSAKILDRLIDLRLLDVGEDGSIAIHDLSDHDRPAYPSDSKEARRDRKQQSRQSSRAVTTEVTTPAHARGEERRGEETRQEAEQSAGALPDENDPLTVICQLLVSASPIEDKKYRAKVDDQTRRYGAEWVIGAYRQAFHDFVEESERPSRWDLLHHAEKHLAGWTRAEELRREEAERKREEVPTRELTPEEFARQELMRKAIGIWVRGGRQGEVPTDVDQLEEWIAQNESAAA